MTDITKLPDKWRNECVDWPSVGNMQLKRVAGELETALPKWTKITDDPDTWPPLDTHVFISRWVESIEIWSVPLATKYIDGHGFVEYEADDLFGDQWRPLYDLDYPPEDIK